MNETKNNSDEMFPSARKFLRKIALAKQKKFNIAYEAAKKIIDDAVIKSYYNSDFCNDSVLITLELTLPVFSALEKFYSSIDYSFTRIGLAENTYAIKPMLPVGTKK